MMSVELFNEVKKCIEPKIVETGDGKSFVLRPDGGITEINLSKLNQRYMPTAKVQSLVGLCDYARLNKDGFTKDNTYLHIEDHNGVLMTTDVDLDMKTQDPIEAKNEAKHSQLTHLIVEQLKLILYTEFHVTEDLDDIAAIASNVSAVKSNTVDDNGISQEVIVKENVIHTKKKTTKPTYSLKSKLCFPEIEAPTCEYIFRIHQPKAEGECTFSLFQSNQHIYNRDVRSAIKVYLQKELPEWRIIG